MAYTSVEYFSFLDASLKEKSRESYMILTFDLKFSFMTQFPVGLSAHESGAEIKSVSFCSRVLNAFVYRMKL